MPRRTRKIDIDTAIDNINQDRTCNCCYYTDRADNASRPEEYLLDSGATTLVMMIEENVIDIEDSTGYVLA